MRLIPLTQGKYAIVDNEDFEELNKYKWYYAISRNIGYAVRVVNGKNIKMHRVILGAPKGYLVDHTNGDGIDNRRDNLRICTQQQNPANARKHKDGKSKYRGVTWRKDSNKWQARIRNNYKCISLGTFLSEVDAALAYNCKAIELFGDFARLNQIIERN